MADVFAGRFELIDPIGSGGAGTVWRAWDRRLHRFCAAKVLRQRHAGALLRFVREQSLRLDHPNVLSPYAWAADDDQALLAMDLVAGGALSSLIADFGPLPERYAAELLQQLLGALDQVHTEGLVHRDVKPGNLLLEATGTGSPVLRLSDFGIAHALGEPRLTRHGTVVGTPGYVAPEVLAGDPPSIAQDLYAAGVTGWQLLTGEEPPVRGRLPARPARSPGNAVWDAVWEVVDGLVQAEPAQRTPSAIAALAALEVALAEPLRLPAYTTDGEPVEVFDHLPPLPPAWNPSGRPPVHRHAPPASVPQSSAPARQSRAQPAQAHGPKPTSLLPAEGAARAETTAVPVDRQEAAVIHGGPSRPSSSGGRPRRRTAVLGGLATVLATVAVGVVVALTDGAENRTPTDGATSPAPTSVPTWAGSSVRPTRTAPVTPLPNPRVKVGEPCGWQEAGSVEAAADGTRVECRQQGSGYRWVKAG